MFTTQNLVRMHDVDMAGILYFPRQFRFIHEALEDFMESENYSFAKLFHEGDFLFVIVHCEADYLAPLTLGDDLDVHMRVSDIGETSFTLYYNIYKRNGPEVGRAKTVHVAIDRAAHKKIPIPVDLRAILTKHLSTPPANQFLGYVSW